MKKCDVIIPVYNAPEYVKLCVYSIFKNTNLDKLGKVYLMNDNSNEFTLNLLKNLEKKYKEHICLITNEENLGFVKNCNKGLKESMNNKDSDCVLLLNTDCLVASHTIEKLMAHVEKNKKIGLICPISSNAANLTLEMFPGYSYMMMDKILEENFKGECFDACTVVGNCLMITKDCIKKTGYLDEIYGMGYCEETDYQFKAMEKGFEAKVAIDTYVFHKAEVSFDTTNSPRSERLKRNMEIFMSRWKDKYDNLLARYNENNPIVHIKNKLGNSYKKINYDEMFVLPFASKTSGGVRVIIDIINYLSINGKNIGMLNLYPGNYNEIMLFNPATVYELSNISCKIVLGTIYESMFLAKKLSNRLNAKCVYFSQGYEFVFENGKRYGEVEMSFKMADYVISVSNYLTNVYKDLLNFDSITIVNGIDSDLIKTKKTNKNRTVTMVLRNEFRKQDYLVIDILKHITQKFNDLTVNLIINNKDMVIGTNGNKTVTINKYYGPLTRPEIYGILKNSDIFIDTSLSEGFGLMPLEAMSFGVVPIVSNSFGINDFITEKNGVIINEVNDPYKYIDALNKLLSNDELYDSLSKEAYKTASKFDFDKVVEKYIEEFNKIENDEYKKLEHNFNDEEIDLLSNYLIDDNKLNSLINQSKNLEVNNIKPRRIVRLIRWLKDLIKTIIFFIKEFFKILFKRY